MGVSRRQGRRRRAAGAKSDPGIERGVGNNRQRRLSRAAHFRKPRLSGLSSADAALCLPALGGNGHRAGGAEAFLGETEQIARVRDAARGRSPDFALDGAVVRDLPELDGFDMQKPDICSMRRFMQDEHGATSIEYALIAGGISIAILSAVQLVGSQVMSTFYDGLTHLF